MPVEIQSLIDKLRHYGVEVSSNGENLKLKGPLQSLPATLVQEVKLHKPQILEWLHEGSHADWFPLSINQRAMWAIHKLAPNNPAFNMMYACRVPDDTDFAALHHACVILQQRHPILRTTYREDADGTAQQAVLPELPLLWEDEVLDNENVEDFFSPWGDAPFDLAEGSIRYVTLRVQTMGQLYFAFCLHHVAVDFWSCQLVMAELSATYDALINERNVRLPAVTGHYRRYVEWQTEYLMSSRGQADLHYWRETLSGHLPLLTLPKDRERPGVMSLRGRWHRVVLPRTTSQALKDFARAQGVTSSTLVMSAYSVWVALLSGQQDVLIGTPAALRPLPELEWMVGDFSNPIVIRSVIHPGHRLRQVLSQVQANMLAALKHQDVPFATVVEQLKVERSIQYPPVFQAMFMWHRPNMRLLEKTVGVHDSIFMNPLFCSGPRGATYDLMLSMVEMDHDLICNWAYNSDIFSHQTVEAFARSLVLWLQDLPARMDLPVRHGWQVIAGELKTDLTTNLRPPLFSAPLPGTHSSTHWWQPLEERWQQATSKWTLICGNDRWNNHDCLRIWQERKTQWQNRLSSLNNSATLHVTLPFQPGADTLFDALALQSLGHHVSLQPSTQPWRATVTDNCAAQRWTRRIAHLQPLANSLSQPARWLAMFTQPNAGAQAELWLLTAFAGLQYGAELVLDIATLLNWHDHWAHTASCATVLTQRQFHDLLEQVRRTQQVSAADWRIAVYGMPESLQHLYQRHQLEPGLQRVVALGYYWPELQAEESFLWPLQDSRDVPVHRLQPLRQPLAIGDVVETSAHQTAGFYNVATQRSLDTGLTVDWRGHRVHDRPDYLAAQGRSISLDSFCQRLRQTQPHLATCIALNLHNVNPEQYRAGDEWALWLCARQPHSTQALVEAITSLHNDIPPPLEIAWVNQLPRHPSGQVDWDTLLAVPRTSWQTLAANPAQWDLHAAPPPARWHHHYVLPDSGFKWAAPASGWQDEAAADNAGFVVLHSHDHLPAGHYQVTLAQQLQRTVQRFPGHDIHFVDSETTEESFTYSDLWQLACDNARQILKAHPQANSLIIATDSNRTLLAGFWTAQLAGLPALPVLLKPDERGPMTGKQAQQLRRVAARLQAPLFVTDPQHASVFQQQDIGQAFPLRSHHITEVDPDIRLPGLDSDTVTPDSAALWLMTSGSSGEPKLVRQTHAALLHRSLATAMRLNITADDRIFNWMPLDHVGGLVMYHLKALVMGCRQWHAPTDSILRAPLRWLDLLSQHRITQSWAPNFAYGLVHQQLVALGSSAEKPVWDLSAVRYLLNGGEAVLANTCRSFVRALAPFGLHRHAILPSWGMSETCSGVLFALDFDPEAADTVSVGAPIADVSVRVSHGQQRLQIRGPCVTRGYEDQPLPLSDDGWFDVGDHARIDQGKVWILGRDNDKLILNGLNLSGSELEAVVESVNGIRPSFCAALAARLQDDASDSLALIVCLDDPDLPQRPPAMMDLWQRIQHALMQAQGVHLRWLIPVTQAEFPKTSIGKIQRKALARRLHEGGFDAQLRRVEQAMGASQTSPQWCYNLLWQARAFAPVVPTEPCLLLRPDCPSQNSSSPDSDTTLDATPLTVFAGPDTYDWHWADLPLPGEGPIRLIWPVAHFAPQYSNTETALLWLVRQTQSLLQQIHIQRPDALTQLILVTHPGVPGVDGDSAFNPWIQSLNQEFPNLRLIWIDHDQQDTVALQQLLQDAQLPAVNRLRNGVWYEPVLQARFIPDRNAAATLPAPFNGDANSVIILAGGAGGLGQALLPLLLEASDSRIALVGQRPRSAAIDSNPQLASLFQQHPQRLCYVSADLAHVDAPEQAWQQITQHWSATLNVAGAINLTGHYHEAPFAELDLQDSALNHTLFTRTRISENLHVWLQHRGYPCVVVHFGSVNGWLGAAFASHYALANGWQHQWVQARQREYQRKQHSVRHVWIGWSLWPNTGLAASLSDVQIQLARQQGFFALSADTGWASLLAALQQGWQQIAIGLDSQALNIRHRIAIDHTNPLAGLLHHRDSLAADAHRPRRAPTSELEQSIHRLWCRLLNQHDMGIDDNFFLLGGHSLVAAQLSQQLQQKLQRQVPVALIFENPTIAELAAALEQADPAGNDLPEHLRHPIPVLEHRHRCAPSAAQQRLLFLQQLEGNRPTFNVPFGLLVDGDLELNLLQAAMQDVVARHALLRSHFICEEGRFWLVESPDLAYQLPVHDLSAHAQPLDAARNRFEALANHPFAMGQAPLFIVELLKLGPQRHALLCVAHHGIFDGWSIGVLMKDLLDSYRHHKTGAPSDTRPLAIQYADFAAWHQQLLASDALEPQRRYWQQQLADLPPQLNLPTDFPRPPIMAHVGDERQFIVPPTLHKALNGFCQQHQITLNMLLMAGFALLLHRYSGQQDFAVGTAVANRRHPQTEDLIGMFVNTLVIRHRIDPAEPLQHFLQQVKITLLDAFAHEDMPFEQLVDLLQPQRDLSQTPLIQTLFVLQNAPLGTVELPGLSARPLIRRSSVAKFDMTLQMAEIQGELIGGLEFNREIFSGATIERFIQQFQALLQVMISGPEGAIGHLQALTETERAHQLHMATREPVTPQTASALAPDLWTRIERHARRTPGAIALEHNGQTLTYAELIQRATALGQHLRAQGIGRGDRVAIILPRSIQLVVSVLGLLYSGACYIPIDPSYPSQRVRYMLQHSRVRLILGAPAHMAALELRDQNWLDIDDVKPQQSATPPALPSGTDPLYVIYTSGSTGRPKGVEIAHRSFLNLLTYCVNELALGEKDTWLAMASVSFDAAMMDLFTLLSTGGKVILANTEQALDGPWLTATLNRPEHRAGRCFMLGTPANWDVLSQGDWPGCPNLTILSGGEALKPKLARKLLAGIDRLYNVYGPTETTVWTLLHPVTQVDDSPIPIGKPIRHCQIQILDPQGQPVPTGVPGELHIGGIGVALGYLHDPELTAARFVDLPAAVAQDQSRSQRWYKTGDLVRWRDDGLVEFLGRIDHQVKIRGHRIELGEVEHALLAHPDVRQAVAQVIQHPQQGDILVASVQSDCADTLTAGTLRQALANLLPSYMLPSQFGIHASFPVTPNGKVDLKALAQALDANLPVVSAGVAPRTDTETRLLATWENLLGRTGIGITDNFFDVGGHSILAIQLVHRIQQTFEKSLPISQIFLLGTVEAMAAWIDADTTTGTDIQDPAAVLVCLKPGNPARPPLVLVHPMGGRVICYSELAHHLPADQPVYGLQLPIENGEPRYSRIEAMADGYLAEIQQRWPEQALLLGGWSLGGMVAFVMAEQLLQAGRPPLGLILIDSSHPASHRERRNLEPNVRMVMTGLEMGLQLFQMPLDLFMLDEPAEGLPLILERLQILQLVDEDFTLADLEARYRLLYQNEQAFLDFDPGRRRVDTPTLVLAASSQPDVRRDPRMLGWHDYAAPLQVEIIEGDHFTILQRPGVERMASRIAQWQRETDAC